MPNKALVDDLRADLDTINKMWRKHFDKHWENVMPCEADPDTMRFGVCEFYAQMGKTIKGLIDIAENEK